MKIDQKEKLSNTMITSFMPKLPDWIRWSKSKGKYVIEDED